MPQLCAYLSFDGNCADAMRFYERALGAKLMALITYGQSPVAEQTPPGNDDRVMHAYLVHDDFALMAGDAPAGQKHTGIQGVAMTLMYPTAAEARRVFGVLAEGGRIDVPLAETFWAEAYGALTDRFGTPWFVNGGAKAM
jgi:PhnB protein